MVTIKYLHFCCYPVTFIHLYACVLIYGSLNLYAKLYVFMVDLHVVNLVFLFGVTCLSGTKPLHVHVV